MAGNPPTLRHTEAWHRQQAERQTLSAAQQRQTSLAMYPPRNSQRRVGNPMALSVLHRGEFRANFR